MFPYHGAIGVHDKDGRIGIGGGLVVDPVSARNLCFRVVQHRERIGLSP